MTRHETTVTRRPANQAHGYPWVAVCTCGWQSPGYVAEHAARWRGHDHETTPWVWCYPCYAYHPEGRHCTVGVTIPTEEGSA